MACIGYRSYADLAANEAGFLFYQDLYDNWGKKNYTATDYSFKIDKFFTDHHLKLEDFNEYNNPNKFHPYLDKWITHGRKRK